MKAIVERVASKVRSHAVYGVVFSEATMGSAYRVMSGSVAHGGDYDDHDSAQAACDILNATAAIHETLLALREPDDGMLEAGMGPFMAAHDLMFAANEPCGPIFTAMIDQALASLKGECDG